MRSRRFARQVLPITTAVAAAFTLSACGGALAQDDVAESDVKVCRDKTGKRVPDSHCGQQWAGATTSPGAQFWYIGRGGRIPGRGQKVTAGSVTPKAGVSYAAASDSTVRRAGFGSTGRSSTVVAVHS